MRTVHPLFEALWESYAAVTPSALAIQAHLEERGEVVVNDHVALRTFDRAPMAVGVIAAPFLDLGYVEAGRYAFAQKQLDARAYSHPEGDPWPRVFISELRTGSLPPAQRAIIDGLVDQLAEPLQARHLSAGCPWAPVSWEDYAALLSVSEYAAWVAAFGLRANHFTVAVNALTTFGAPPLVHLNDWIESLGHPLNAAGGKIKGSPQVLLEQSSTLADAAPVAFASGQIVEIPSCYVEFALRHPEPGGGLFDGFVTESADKIFESTDRR